MTNEQEQKTPEQAYTCTLRQTDTPNRPMYLESAVNQPVVTQLQIMRSETLQQVLAFFIGVDTPSLSEGLGLGVVWLIWCSLATLPSPFLLILKPGN